MATYKQAMMILWLMHDYSVERTSDLIKELLEQRELGEGLELHTPK